MHNLKMMTPANPSRETYLDTLQTLDEPKLLADTFALTQTSNEEPLP